MFYNSFIKTLYKLWRYIRIMYFINTRIWFDALKIVWILISFLMIEYSIGIHFSSNQKKTHCLSLRYSTVWYFVEWTIHARHNILLHMRYLPSQTIILFIFVVTVIEHNHNYHSLNFLVKNEGVSLWLII